MHFTSHIRNDQGFSLFWTLLFPLRLNLPYVKGEFKIISRLMADLERKVPSQTLNLPQQITGDSPTGDPGATTSRYPGFREG